MPEDWPWSSARAHLRGERDALCETEPLVSRIGDWRRYLDAGTDAQSVDVLRRHTRTDRPISSEAFITELEARLGRALRSRKPGPKPGGAE